MRSIRKVAAVALSVVAASAAIGCGDGSAGSSDTINIGMLLDLTGPAAPFGIPERDAIEALVEEMNANGGVDGRTIELSVYDGGTDPTRCPRGATELTQQENVVAIVGGTTGSCTLAAGPAAARAEVPLLTPNGTIEVTSKENEFWPYMFRPMTNDLVTTKALFDKVVESGAKRIAVFFQEDAYGQNTAEYIDEELAPSAPEGVEIVTSSSAAPDATDVTPQATEVRNANADAVIMQVNSVGLGAAFIRASDTVGLDAQLWGSAGLGQRAFVEAAGPAVEGVNLVLFGANPYAPDQRARELLKRLGQDQLEGFAELIATNGLLAITEAIPQVEGDLTGESLKEALEGICGVETYSAGELCFTESRDGYGAEGLITVQVKDGKFVTLDEATGQDQGGG